MATLRAVLLATLLLAARAHAQTPADPAPALRAAIHANAAELLTLKAWDDAGDVPVAQLPEIATATARLPGLEALQKACVTLPDKLTETEEAQLFQAVCKLQKRAKDIVERQYLAAAKRAVRFPESTYEAAKRYAREGRVAWHTLQMFARLEQEMAQRTEILKPYAQLVGLPILGELFHEGFSARRQLRHVMKVGQKTLGLPGEVTDTQFAGQVRAAAMTQALTAPMPEGRTELVAVRPIDAAWSIRVEKGREVRRERRAAVIWRRPRAQNGCLVTWVQAVLRKGKPPSALVLDWEDDVRWVSCPQ